MPVGQGARGGGQGVLLPRPVQVGDGGEHLHHLPAVGPGVHHHGSVQCAGDTVGKLQAGEPPAQGSVGQPGQGDTALRPQTAVDLTHLIQAARLEHKALIAVVGHQQIAAVSQEKRGDSNLCGGPHGGGGLLPAPGQRHQPGRAADAERGVPLHGLVFPHLQAGYPPQGTRQSLKSVHSDLPHAKYIGLLLYQNSGGNRRGQAFFLACPRPVYPNRSNSARPPRKMFRSMRRWVP